MGQPWRMELPLGVVDPLFVGELCQELGLTVAEINHGRGALMSAWEISIFWPLFFGVKSRERERAQKAEEAASQRTLGGP